MRQGTLVARRIDVAGGRWTSEPVILADRVGYDPIFNLGGFSISGNGRIAYRAATVGRQQLVWYDRSGKAIGPAGDADPNGVLYPELSPDGRRVAMGRLTTCIRRPPVRPVPRSCCWRIRTLKPRRTGRKTAVLAVFPA